MDYDFGIFEKLKEIYNAARKLAWGAVGAFGTITFIAWACLDWVAARAVSMINWIKGYVPEIDLNPANVTGVDWGRINQFVPINEGLWMCKTFLALAGAMILFRLLKKFIPVG